MAIFGFYGLAITGAALYVLQLDQSNRAVVDGVVLSLQDRSSTSGTGYSRTLFIGYI